MKNDWLKFKIKKYDEAFMDQFRKMIVVSEEGKSHEVPIIWGTNERAAAAAFQANIRKDNSLAVDRIRLPLLNAWRIGLRCEDVIKIDYNLCAWTLYQEDANQLLEQILYNFHPSCSIGGSEEKYLGSLKLDAITNNYGEEDKKGLRVLKTLFSMTFAVGVTR